MFLSEWREFPSVPCLAGGKKTRVLMLLKSRVSLTCFRACFPPGRAKDLSALRHIDYKFILHNACIKAPDLIEKGFGDTPYNETHYV